MSESQLEFFNEVFSKGRKKAFVKMWTDSILRDMELEPDKWFPVNLIGIEKYNLVRSLIDARGRDWSHIRVCLTLKPENDKLEFIDQFMARIEKMSRWKWIKNMYWNIEWKDHELDPNNGIVNVKHMHSHILIEKDESKRYGPCKRQIINRFKDWGYAYIRPSNESNKDYIKGIKEDKKMNDVANDKLVRKLLGLEDIYKKL